MEKNLEKIHIYIGDRQLKKYTTTTILKSLNFGSQHP